MALKDEIKEQNKKIKDMTPKQKWEHFWYYNKYYVMIAAVAVIFVVYLILHLTVLRPLPYGFRGYFLNTGYDDMTINSDVTGLTDDFTKYENIDTSKYRVGIDYVTNIDYGVSDSYTLAQDIALTAEGERGDIDYMAGPENVIDTYVNANFFANTIDTYLEEETFQYFDEQGLVYYYEAEDHNLYPIGIYITDAPLVKAYNIYPNNADENNRQEVVYSIVSYSTRPEMAVDMLLYLYQMK